MPCEHLKQLYQLCLDQKLKLSGSDLVRIVCEQCGEQEVCPSMLWDEYDAREAAQSAKQASRESGSESGK